MKPHVIGADRLNSGGLFCVSTDRSHNTVYVHEDDAWRRLIGWSGHEVTACCACGEKMVCAALDDAAYVIDGTTVNRVTLPENTRTYVHGCCATSDHTALLGGNGGLFSLDVRHLSAARIRLSAFNVTRPGRNIHNVVHGGGRTWILGLKNLLVDFRGDAATEPVPRDVLRGREVMFNDAVEFDGRLWLAAGEGARAALASLDGHKLEIHDPPSPGRSLSRLAVLNGELVVAGDQVWIGRPGAWRELRLPGISNDAAVIEFVPTASGRELCALANTGQSWFTDGRTTRAVPVF
jgi:hypothetical protein